MRTAVLTLSRLSSPCWCLILLSIGSPCMAQEQSGSPFACVEGAVQLDIDNDPGLTFEALDGSPGYFPAHEFTFDQSVFQRVRVYLAATLPEEFVGRASEAKLSVYVETSASIDAASAQRSQWWQLVPAPGREATANENPSHSLVFDAMRIANCFGIGRGQSDCAFADVSLAASDENVPMIVIAFTQDLGGANANNWIDSRLLGGVHAANPLVGFSGNLGARVALSTVDAINNASKAAILYLLPLKYVTPNMLSQGLFALIQQGFAAPKNLVVSARLNAKLGKKATAAIDAGMGEGFAASIAGHTTGPLTRFNRAAARFYGKAIDVPFRRASFLHESMRAGYKSPTEINRLLFDPALRDDRRASVGDEEDVRLHDDRRLENEVERCNPDAAEALCPYPGG